MRTLWRSVTVEGLNLERFLRQAGEADVTFRRMKRKGRNLTCLVREEQLQLLTSLCEKSGWRLGTGNRHGIGRMLLIAGKRWTLAGSCVVILLLAIVSWQFVWGIDILDAAVYRSDTEAYLQQMDVHRGKMKRHVNLEQIRDALEWRYPKVAWIECGWRGGMLQVRFHQGTPMGEAVTHHGAADVVAERGGIIDSMVVLAGTAVVAPGDIVRPGQVLIAGHERGAEDETHVVSARGIVMARVWDGAAVRMKTVETETVYTGRTRKIQRIDCPWFAVTPQNENAFEQYDASIRRMSLGGLFFPFMWQVETQKEAVFMTKPREMDDLRREAEQSAMRKLREKVGFDDDFVDKWVDYCMIEDEVLEAVGVGERLMDIGAARNVSDE